MTETRPGGPASGALVLVGTPIGNLADCSPRALEALRDADAIACEDTRRTGRLLELLGVGARPPLIVCNEHTEAAAAAKVIERVRRGERVVVVSDAGMPGISDPGERLVRAALDAEVAVEVVPGPSAALAALVVSGLPAARFVFEGFLPRAGGARRTRVAEVAQERRTVVIFEAPHRLARTLDDLEAACGPDRPVVVARELTKRFEEVWRGDLAGAVAWAAATAPRGEVAVVLGGAAPPPTADDATIEAALAAELAAGASVRDAAAAVANRLGVPRRRVYGLAVALSGPGGPHGASG